MPDIDVDPKQLSEFINVLEDYLNTIHGRLSSVEVAWSDLREKISGQTATKFTKEYEQTEDEVNRATKSVNEVLVWLRRYDQIVREFDNL